MRNVIIAAAVVICIWGTTAPAAEECTGTVSGSLASKRVMDNETEWRFAVEVHADTKTCAYVEFDFITELTGAGGKKEETRKPMKQKVRSNAEKARLVTFRVPDGATLSKWEFDYTGCRPCPAGE